MNRCLALNAEILIYHSLLEADYKGFLHTAISLYKWRISVLHIQNK